MEYTQTNQYAKECGRSQVMQHTSRRNNGILSGRVHDQYNALRLRGQEDMERYNLLIDKQLLIG